VTICKNSESTLARAIESVLDLDYTNFEYILVDGLSNDNTIQIIESYKSDFESRKIRYKFCSELDLGISDAFNKGVRLCNGDYVLFLNSDDWIEATILSNVVSNFKENIDVFCGNLRYWIADSGKFKVRKSRVHLLNFGMYVMHPTVIVKRSLLMEFVFDINLSIAMDYDFILGLYIQNYSFCYIDKVFSNMQSGGISSNKLKMRIEENNVMKSKLPFTLYHIARLKILVEDYLLKHIVGK
jgi:glycosyltransferase involved in cell wall biosynthesis